MSRHPRGCLLFRSADRLPDGSLFKSSTKSSGLTGWWCHGLPRAGITPLVGHDCLDRKSVVLPLNSRGFLLGLDLKTSEAVDGPGNLEEPGFGQVPHLVRH
jgi:hypothetical protein